ncbi:alkaline phosphatase family protein [Bacillus sp. FJAT-45037]|uniref:alkaline phosphatase family protein n=1 Tax=Bacillus sp. FJAT-45037 TaxID=2011007 RepID=UPI000C24CF4B|nr:alkaline phosphatase family protein [Bacillus sp. FJAT-45037]
MWYRIFISLLIILFLCSCVKESDSSTKGATIQASENTGKKVMVVMIDSMTSELIDKGISEGRTPALAFLKENGKVFDDLIAPFPSMSVVIESSLLTGVGPNAHHVPGLIWYHPNEERLVDYGSTIPRTLKLGTKQVVQDGLNHLNNFHLNPKIDTIYDELAKQNRSTGSVNMLLYRGPKKHILHVPPFVSESLHMEKSIITKGPDLLSFGQLVKPDAVKDRSLPDHLYEKYGLNDQYSVNVVQSLIQSEQQPDFLMAFLPDFDTEAHVHGPHYLDGFARADYQLQTILNSYDSWEQALEDTIFIILGDHNQVLLHDKGEHTAIELEALLEPWSIAELLDGPKNSDLIIANNHRMAYIHRINPNIHLKEIADPLLNDDRIDHIAWRENNRTLIQSSHVQNTLTFTPNGPWTDEYGQTWHLEGDPNVLDLTLNDKEKTITFGQYPDGLEQMDSALKSQDAALIVTARPGYTLKTEDAPVHYGGGEHGGFHQDDTRAALLVAGTDHYPEFRRIRDLKDYFISLFQEEIEPKG